MSYLEEIYYVGKDLSEKNRKLIEKAYVFAEKAHDGQIQAKKPFFEHPKQVGFLLASWGQGAEAISAGLLHDTVEDADVKLSEIKKKFGSKVALYVDGMSWEREKVNGKMKKDYVGLYRKFLGYVKKDPVLAIIKAGDEMSRSEPKSEEKFVTALKEKGLWEKFQDMINTRYRGFWIPFFEGIGLHKVVDKIEERGRFVQKRYADVTLYDYISQDDLSRIKEEIGKMKCVEVLA
jgi:hypothetical protein